MAPTWTVVRSSSMKLVLAKIVAVARSYCFMHQKVGLTPMRV